MVPTVLQVPRAQKVQSELTAHRVWQAQMEMLAPKAQLVLKAQLVRKVPLAPQANRVLKGLKAQLATTTSS